MLSSHRLGSALSGQATERLTGYRQQRNITCAHRDLPFHCRMASFFRPEWRLASSNGPAAKSTVVSNQPRLRQDSTHGYAYAVCSDHKVTLHCLTVRKLNCSSTRVYFKNFIGQIQMNRFSFSVCRGSYRLQSFVQVLRLSALRSQYVATQYRRNAYSSMYQLPRMLPHHIIDRTKL